MLSVRSWLQNILYQNISYRNKSAYDDIWTAVQGTELYYVKTEEAICGKCLKFEHFIRYLLA